MKRGRPTDPMDPPEAPVKDGSVAARPELPADEKDPELVVDDDTSPAEAALGVASDPDIVLEEDIAAFVDEDYVLDEDDSESVEVVVNLSSTPKPTGTPVAPRPRPARPPEVATKPLRKKTSEPAAPKPVRPSRLWMAAAAGLLLLLGAGLVVFLSPHEEAERDVYASRPVPVTEKLPEPEAEAESEVEPEPMVSYEDQNPELNGLPPAPEPTPLVDPAAGNPEHVRSSEAAPSVAANPPDDGAEKNIETSAIAKDETIVELKNGNTFAGRMKRFDSRGLDLEIWNGHITLSTEQLAGVLPPDAVDYQPIENFPWGFVEMPNRNRIYGRVFKVTPSRIILVVNGARFAFSPSTVKLGHLKEGEEPPPEPGTHLAPEPPSGSGIPDPSQAEGGEVDSDGIDTTKVPPADGTDGSQIDTPLEDQPNGSD